VQHRVVPQLLVISFVQDALNSGGTGGTFILLLMLAPTLGFVVNIGDSSTRSCAYQVTLRAL